MLRFWLYLEMLWVCFYTYAFGSSETRLKSFSSVNEAFTKIHRLLQDDLEARERAV